MNMKHSPCPGPVYCSARCLPRECSCLSDSGTDGTHRRNTRHSFLREGWVRRMTLLLLGPLPQASGEAANCTWQGRDLRDPLIGFKWWKTHCRGYPFLLLAMEDRPTDNRENCPFKSEVALKEKKKKRQSISKKKKIGKANSQRSGEYNSLRVTDDWKKSTQGKNDARRDGAGHQNALQNPPQCSPSAKAKEPFPS